MIVIPHPTSSSFDSCQTEISCSQHTSSLLWLLRCPRRVEMVVLVIILCIFLLLYPITATYTCEENGVRINGTNYSQAAKLIVSRTCDSSIDSVIVVGRNSGDWVQFDYVCDNGSTKVIYGRGVHEGRNFTRDLENHRHCPWHACIQDYRTGTWYNVAKEINECIYTSSVMHSSVVTQSSAAFVSSSLITKESIALTSTSGEVKPSSSSSILSTTSIPVTPTISSTFEGQSSNSDIYSYLAVILMFLLLFAAGSIGLLIISLFFIKKKAKKWKRNNIVSDMWQDEPFDLSIATLSASPSLVTVYCDQDTNLNALSVEKTNGHGQVIGIKNSYIEDQVV